MNAETRPPILLLPLTSRAVWGHLPNLRLYLSIPTQAQYSLCPHADILNESILETKVGFYTKVVLRNCSPKQEGPGGMTEW